MAIAVRNDFSLDAPFTVSAEAFLFAGKHYAKGEPFPWREIGLDPRELWQLWLALKVDCSSAAQPEPDPHSSDAVAAKFAPAVETAVEMPGVASATADEIGKRERRARSRASR